MPHGTTHGFLGLADIYFLILWLLRKRDIQVQRPLLNLICAVQCPQAAASLEKRQTPATGAERR